jgi:hypothetical protein
MRASPAPSSPSAPPISEVFHEARLGARFLPEQATGREPGPAGERRTYGSFLSFDDPDGNGWIVQEITGRD